MLLILFIFVYLQSLLFEAPVGTQASQTPSQCSYSLQTALSNCSRLLMSNLAAAASVRLAGDNSILSCTAGSSHHVCSWVTILTTCFFLQHAPVWKRQKELSAIITTSSMILCTAGFCLSSLCLRESTQIGKPSPLPLQKQRHRGCTDNCTLHPGQFTQSKSVQEGLFSTHNNSTECPAGPYLHQWTWLDQMRDQSPPKSFQCKRACKQYSKSNQAFSSIPCHFI